MEIKEKVAHLKGLMEGMEYDTTTKEGKLIAGIIDILDDMAESFAEVTDDIETLYDYADELDADLGDVESEVFEIDDEPYDDYEDDDFDDEDGEETLIQPLDEDK